jgi:hypothetical protein
MISIKKIFIVGILTSAALSHCPKGPMYNQIEGLVKAWAGPVANSRQCPNFTLDMFTNESRQITVWNSAVYNHVVRILSIIYMVAQCYECGDPSTDLHPRYQVTQTHAPVFEIVANRCLETLANAPSFGHPQILKKTLSLEPVILRKERFGEVLTIDFKTIETIDEALLNHWETVRAREEVALAKK